MPQGQENSVSLSGKTALVTGAGIRLGRAIAEELGRLGATVALHCHASTAGAEQALQVVESHGATGAVFQADLSVAQEAQRLVGAVSVRFGQVDILVNSSGLYERFDLVDTPLESLERQWAVNARAPYLLSQAFARAALAEKRSADIVNIVDIGGTANVWRHYSAYLMSKGALWTLTQSLALELAPLIRVNAVAPGTVLPPTDFSADALEALRQRIPQQRFGQAQDVVEAVRFLVTGPQFMTGQLITLDGGRHLA
jgi:pteridine reductase